MSFALVRVTGAYCIRSVAPEICVLHGSSTRGSNWGVFADPRDVGDRFGRERRAARFGQG